MKFGGDYFDGVADGREVVQDLAGVSLTVVPMGGRLSKVWRGLLGWYHASGGVGAREKKRLGEVNQPQRVLKQVFFAIPIFSSVWAGGGEEKCRSCLITSQSILCVISPFLFPCCLYQMKIRGRGNTLSYYYRITTPFGCRVETIRKC